MVAGGFASAEDLAWEPARSRTPVNVLPAEFSHQDAILITWDDEDADMQAAVTSIVAAAADRVRFYMLVPNGAAELNAQRQLLDRGVPRHSIRFLHVPTDSVWTRDFGPMVVLQGDGSCRMVDSDYGHGDRVGDDLVPAAIAPTLGMDTLRPPITADGGNIQTNGRGLALTTTAILVHNAERGYREPDVARLFRTYYGISQLVFLEPLAGETTGHVDMFAVFVGPNTIAVGQYDYREDPVNAEILDRNARRIAAIETDDGPVRVVRVPMPPHDEKVWRTYTNVLFANGTMLVPRYPGVDPQGHADVVSIYRRLLPEWRVIGIDCSGLIQWGGAIHCVTMNLCKVPSIQDLTNHFAGERTDRRRNRPDANGARPASRDEFSRRQPEDEERPTAVPTRLPPLIVPLKESIPVDSEDDAVWRPATQRQRPAEIGQPSRFAPAGPRFQVPSRLAPREYDENADAPADREFARPSRERYDAARVQRRPQRSTAPSMFVPNGSAKSSRYAVPAFSDDSESGR